MAYPLVPFYYVIPENGPSSPPYLKHADIESAEREAERVAKTFPDRRFLVVRTVSAYRVTTLVREEFADEDIHADEPPF